MESRLLKLVVWCCLSLVTVRRSSAALVSIQERPSSGAVKPSSSRPPYISCTDSNECGTFECCSIGMGRFSVPNCKGLGGPGEVCSPGATPTATNLSYPDGWDVSLSNVYFTLCPCSPGLSCSHQTGLCTDNYLSPQDNFLYD